jgi:type II secretory pathway component PulK
MAESTAVMVCVRGARALVEIDAAPAALMAAFPMELRPS